MPRLRQRLTTALAAIVMALAATVPGGCSGGSSGAPIDATVLPEPLPLPEFVLTDQDGARFSRDNFRQGTSLLFFGFTHCPDICPATLQQLATARKKIAEGQSGKKAGPPPEIVLVSVDPERDTPEKLKDYVNYFGEGITAVTGTMDQIKKLTGALGIFFEKVPGDDDGYSVSHSTAVLVINPDAELSALFSSPLKIDSIVHDVPVLMASP